MCVRVVVETREMSIVHYVCDVGQWSSPPDPLLTGLFDL